MEELELLNPFKKRYDGICLKIWRIIIWGRGSTWSRDRESLVKRFENHSHPRNSLIMDFIGSLKHLCKTNKVEKQVSFSSKRKSWSVMEPDLGFLYLYSMCFHHPTSYEIPTLVIITGKKVTKKTYFDFFSSILWPNAITTRLMWHCAPKIQLIELKNWNFIFI